MRKFTDNLMIIICFTPFYYIYFFNVLNASTVTSQPWLLAVQWEELSITVTHLTIFIFFPPLFLKEGISYQTCGVKEEDRRCQEVMDEPLLKGHEGNNRQASDLTIFILALLSRAVSLKNITN